MHYALALMAVDPPETVYLLWGTNEPEIFMTLLEGANQVLGSEWDIAVGVKDQSYCGRMADEIEKRLDEIDLISQVDEVGNLYDSTIKLVDFLRNCNGFKTAHGIVV